MSCSRIRSQSSQEAEIIATRIGVSGIFEFQLCRPGFAEGEGGIKSYTDPSYRFMQSNPLHHKTASANISQPCCVELLRQDCICAEMLPELSPAAEPQEGYQ